MKKKDQYRKRQNIQANNLIPKTIINIQNWKHAAKELSSFITYLSTIW